MKPSEITTQISELAELAAAVLPAFKGMQQGCATDPQLKARLILAVNLLERLSTV